MKRKAPVIEEEEAEDKGAAASDADEGEEDVAESDVEGEGEVATDKAASSKMCVVTSSSSGPLLIDPPAPRMLCSARRKSTFQVDGRLANRTSSSYYLSPASND